MRHHASKLEKANVVAGFDTQDEADEALLELRLAGFSDKQIGYYFPTAHERMEDLLANHHRFAASIIWGVIGLVVGTAAAILIARSWYPTLGPDFLGMVATCAMCGALFLGTAGGMMGLWTARPGEDVPTPAGVTSPFVLSVEAGDRREEVRSMLRRRGGYDLLPHAATEPGHRRYIPGELPA